MHADVLAMSPGGIADYTRMPKLEPDGRLAWEPTSQAAVADDSVARPAAAPFSATGGLKLLAGNLGRAVIKVSAVPKDRHVVEAPARTLASQEAMLAAFKAGELERDVVVGASRARAPTACPNCTS
ncbi:MAG: dihydroxy-acid dehydratase [Rubrivivax sp.]